MKHNLYTLIAISALITGSTFAGNVINTNPTNGTAMIDNQEVRYYVSSDQKFIHFDHPSKVVVARFTCSSSKPAGYTGSFNYEDKTGTTRTCHYQTQTAISKNSMVTDQ